MAKFETMVVTCTKCRAWYNMDMEEGLDNHHFNMRTGELCPSDDDNWVVDVVPGRDDWQYAK